MRVKTGWNLGNTLDAISRAENPTPEMQETAWYNPVTTPEMIQLVKDAGFSILRVPVTWEKQLENGHHVKENFMNRVQEIVDYGMDCGLTVILNMHHENWHFPSEENYPFAKERFISIWQQIGKRFAEYDEKLIFEAMNEPRKTKTPVEWNGGDEEGRAVVMRLNADFVKTIREMGGKNASRFLMVPTYAACSEEAGMIDFAPPKGDNIIVSLHAYPPPFFALLPNMEHLNTWTDECEKELDALFERIDKYFLSKNIPVIMGELGARDKNNLPERVKWAHSYMRRAQAYNVPSVLWDNGGREFQLMDRRNLTWKYPELVKAITGNA